MNEALVDSSPVVKTDLLPREAPVPTLPHMPLVTSIVVPSDTLGSSDVALRPRLVFAIYRPLLTQTSLIRIGKLSYYADRCASRIEVSVSSII